MQSIWSPSVVATVGALGERRGFCPSCGARRTIATHLTHKAGYKKSTAHTGAVTLIQRFGSALNLNIHFHMLFLDGVYVGEAGSCARFRWVKAPTTAELRQLTHTIAHRLARYLERLGLLERDAEHSYLTLDNADEDPMDQLRGHSITYRIAVGPNKAVKSSPCKRCLMNAVPMTRRRSETWLDYSGHPALRPSGQPSAVQNRSRRFCLPARQCGGQSLST